MDEKKKHVKEAPSMFVLHNFTYLVSDQRSARRSVLQFIELKKELSQMAKLAN